MFCQNCGNSIAPNAPFCSVCGAPQPPAGQANPQFPPPGPQPPPPGPQIPFAPRQGLSAATGRWISAGWELTKSDLTTWILTALVVLVLQSAVPLILNGALIAGFHIAFARKMLYGRAEVGDVFKGFNYFVPALIASLVILAFTFAGFLLCIIPGFVVAAMYMFTYLFIVDKRMDFWPAMQASHAIVRQDYLGFTLFFLALGLLQILGVLACIVGLLVTIPIMYGAITAAYRDLVGFEPESIQP